MPLPVQALHRQLHRQAKLLDDNFCMPRIHFNVIAFFGPPHKSSIPKVGGGSMPIVYEQANFKPRYLDEYTGEVLPPPLIRAAIEEKLDYFNSKVWKFAPWTR